MSYSTVSLDREGAVAHLTLNRPEVLNAANPQLVRDLRAAGEEVASDPTIRVVSLMGAGTSFCSGIDLTALSRKEIGLPWFEDWERALRVYEVMDKIVIAGIRGYCIGGGLQIALVCDLRISSETGIFGVPAVREALIPGMSTWRLPRQVGLGLAQRLVLTGENVGAAEALQMGLIHWVAPDGDLETRVRELEQRFLKTTPTSTRMSKRLLNRAFDLDFEEFLAAYVPAQGASITSPEHQEVMRQWREMKAADQPWERGR